MGYNDNYLWTIFKDLSEPNFPIYIDKFQEQEKETPHTYLIIDTLISDTTNLYGDGKSILRNIDFTLTLHSTSLRNIKSKAKLIRQRLEDLDFPYSQLSLILDSVSKYYSTQFISSYNYE